MPDFYPQRSLESLEREIDGLRRNLGTGQATASAAVEACAEELRKLETSVREKRRVSASWFQGTP
jgi:hypothetical protein